MANQNKRNRSGGAPAQNRAKSTGQGGKPTGTGSSRPGVVRQPIAGAGTQTRRQQIDRALPPFSVKRYVAIWLPLMLVLIGAVLVLAQCNGGNTAGSAAQPTPTGTTPAAAGNASGTEPTTAATQQSSQGGFSTTPTVASNTSDAAAPTQGSTGAGQASGGAGKYMVIETARGRIVAKLHTEADAKVPNTIANFEKKANAGEFNGRVFHRVENWVIQGGDPLGNGTGGGNMPSEYNNLPFKAGALGVARGQDPAINNDSQFFIVKQDADYLNGQYTNFGQVTEGMDVVNQIQVGDKITKITVEQR